MIGRKALVNTALAVGVVAVGFGAYSTVGTSAASTSTVTNTVTATTANVLQTVSATGNVIAPVQAVASFTTSGTLTKIMAKVGDVVTAGQPIAQIDDTTQKAALDNANLNLWSTQESINTANTIAPDVQAAVTVANAQAAASVTSAKASLNAAYTSAAQDAASAQASVDSAQASLNQAQAQLNADTATLTENQAAYTAAQATSDTQAPAGEDLNQENLRYSQDSDTCSAKGTPTDGVQCADLPTLTRLLQAVSSATKSVASDTNAVTQASNALTTAQRNQAATAVKDNQSAASAARSVQSANLSLVGTQASNQTKVAGPTSAVLSQQAAQLAQAQAAVVTAQKAEDATTLTAPIAGTIVALNGTVGLPSSGSSSSGTGSSSSSSSSSSSGFATIVDLTQLQVRAGFAEADAAELVIGQDATITFAALPNLTATAKVTEVDSLATVSSNVVTYLATLTLDSAQPTVKPGMTATASVVAQHADGVVALPTAAVPTRGTSGTVTVRAADGKETQVPITIGLRGDSLVEIKSGLKAGDVVVIRTALAGGGSSTRAGATTGLTGTVTGGGGGGAGGGFGGFPGAGG